MTEKLDEITLSLIDKIPSQVQLKLPKLKKVEKTKNVEPPKIKLPKLKKVMDEVNA